MERLLSLDSKGILPRGRENLLGYVNRGEALLEQVASSDINSLSGIVRKEWDIKLLEPVSTEVIKEAAKRIESSYGYNLGWAKAYWATIPDYDIDVLAHLPLEDDESRTFVLGNMMFLWDDKTSKYTVPPTIAINLETVGEIKLFPTLIHELLHIPMSFIFAYATPQEKQYDEMFAESLTSCPEGDMHKAFDLLENKFCDKAGYVFGRLNLKEVSDIASGSDPVKMIKDRKDYDRRIYIISQKLNL